MFRAGLPQALSVWSDLEAAVRGEHGYGGNVAEIYVYRLMPHSPSAERTDLELGKRALAEAARAANEDLYDLLTLFCEQRDAEVHVDRWNVVDHIVVAGPNVRRFDKLGSWLREHDEDHRWHVRVRPKKRKESL